MCLFACELIKYLNIYYYPNVCRLTITHQETIEKNPSRLQTHVRRQTVVDVH